MVLEPPPMPTPQLAAAAPIQDCPKCGRRMQHIRTTASTHHYACYAHSEQNADGPEPHYFNIHYNTKLNPDGTIRVKE